MKERLPQLGAPDPERNTSTIIDESAYDEHAASRDQELESPLCYFNDEAFAHGEYVQSGAEMLRCDRGVWVRKGERKPE